MVEIPPVNYAAVFVATLAYFSLGGLWYSKVLFGNHWMKAIGKTEEEVKAQTMSPGAAMGAMAVVTLVSVIALAWILSYAGVEDVAAALAIALILSLGFLLVPIAAGVFFEGRLWTLFVINFGYHTTGTLIAAIILGLWR